MSEAGSQLPWCHRIEGKEEDRAASKPNKCSEAGTMIEAGQGAVLRGSGSGREDGARGSPGRLWRNDDPLS